MAALAAFHLSPLAFTSALSPPAAWRCRASACRRRRRLLEKRGCSASVSPQIAGSGSVPVGGGDAEISRATLLWRAAKLPIYSVALVPLTVGNAAAYFSSGVFFAKRFFILLAASIFVITWLNLSNDVYDFDTGADRNKKESVVNIFGSRKWVLYAAIASLILGLTGLVWAFLDVGDIRFLLLIICAIFCGYVYQCPPFRLSHQGLGEPLCFMAFGPFATTAFYFSSSIKSVSSGTGLLSLTNTVLASSLLVGLTTTMILFCSHFHQIEGDRAVGKLSPLVRIGTERGSRVIWFSIIALYSMLLIFGLSKALPPSCILLCALTLPMGYMVADFVAKNHKDELKIFMAKYYCVRLHASFGIALALGLFLARRGH